MKPKKIGKLKDPTPQDVLDYLSGREGDGNGFSSTEELDAAVEAVTKPFNPEDLSEEDRIALNTASDPENIVEDEPEAAPDTPLPVEPELPSTHDANDFTMDLDEFRTVSVTDEEKDLYMKSLLNDTPYTIQVEVIPGFSAKVRSRTVYYDDLIYDMVRQSAANGEVLGPESGFTKLMRLLAGIQIIEVQGKNVEFPIDNKWTREERIRKLWEHVHTVYDGYNLMKWNAVVKAVRMFDAKQKICNDRLLDRTFWDGASIS